MVGSNVLYPNIKSYRILVIGDVMLDTYFSGDVNRISPEAPVPVFKKKEERSVLGGAFQCCIKPYSCWTECFDNGNGR